MTIINLSDSGTDRIKLAGGEASGANLIGTPGDDREYIYDYSGPGPGMIDLGAGQDSVTLVNTPSGGLTISNTESVYFVWESHEDTPFGPITINNFDPASSFISLEGYSYASLDGNGWPGNVSPFTYGLMRFVQVGDDAVLQVDYYGTGEFTDFLTLTDTQVSELRAWHFFTNGWTIDTPGTGWQMNGTADGEILYGTVEADVLNGGAGNDIIKGGYGNDLLTGGAGADIFEFARNVYHNDPGSRPAITDFNPAEDQVDLREYGYLYFDDILSRAYQDGANIVIEFAAMERITLQNVQLSSLTADNFVGILSGGSITALPPPETLDPTVKFQQIITGPIEIASGETLFGYISGGLMRGPELSPFLNITNHGTIWASGDMAMSALDLVNAWGNTQRASITNTGAIYSVSGTYGKAISGDVYTLENSGVIAAVGWGGQVTAVELIGTQTEIINSGTISARSSTDMFTSFAIGYFNGLGYNASILNQATGRIVIEAPAAIAIYLGSAADLGPDPRIQNQGLIQAVSNSDYASIGIYCGTGGPGCMDLLNTGTLRADIAVYLETYPYGSFASPLPTSQTMLAARFLAT